MSIKILANKVLEGNSLGNRVETHSFPDRKIGCSFDCFDLQRFPCVAICEVMAE